MRLLWFHAFSRLDVPQMFDVLLRGPQPPTFRTRTKDNEATLGIVPPRTYCYLGRTIDAFGDAALALSSTAVPTGTMSPFDTGGLVKHIKPVDTWEQDARRKLLTDYSWSTADMAVVLAAYPSDAQVADYLDLAKVPSSPGPHAVWSPKLEANIWNASNDWRAWTWEGRWEGMLPSALNVVKWTCAPTRYPDVRRHAEGISSLETQATLKELMPRYVHGGVGALVKALLLEQAA